MQSPPTYIAFSYSDSITTRDNNKTVRLIQSPSVLSLTKDSQIGTDLRVCADEENRADFDRRSGS